MFACGVIGVHPIPAGAWEATSPFWSILIIRLAHLALCERADCF